MFKVNDKNTRTTIPRQLIKTLNTACTSKKSNSASPAINITLQVTLYSKARPGTVQLDSVLRPFNMTSSKSNMTERVKKI